MSIKIMNEAWEVRGIDPTAKLVLMCLADHANEDDRTCWPSISTIARKCDVSPRTVQRHMRALEDGGYIRLRKQRTGDSTLYYILPELADGTERGDKMTGVSSMTEPMTPVTRTPDTGDTQTIKNHHITNNNKQTRARATRLPDDWEPEPLSVEFLANIGPVTPSVLTNELDKFRDYWKAQPGIKGRKLDWQATWRNWLRNSKWLKPSKPNRHDDDMAFLAEYVKGDTNG